MPRTKLFMTGTAELNATIERVAPDVLGLLADGVPRTKAAIVEALAGRHDGEDVALALIRLAVTGRVEEASGKYVLGRRASAPDARPRLGGALSRGCPPRRWRTAGEPQERPSGMGHTRSLPPAGRVSRGSRSREEPSRIVAVRGGAANANFRASPLEDPERRPHTAAFRRSRRPWPRLQRSSG